MYVCGKSSLRNGCDAKANGCDARAFSRETLKAGFPASNASSFLARARRCFRVRFAFTDFFRFAFPEAVALARRRFDCGFFFGIRCVISRLFRSDEFEIH